MKKETAKTKMGTVTFKQSMLKLWCWSTINYISQSLKTYLKRLAVSSRIQGISLNLSKKMLMLFYQKITNRMKMLQKITSNHNILLILSIIRCIRWVCSVVSERLNKVTIIYKDNRIGMINIIKLPLIMLDIYWILLWSLITSLTKWTFSLQIGFLI